MNARVATTVCAGGVALALALAGAAACSDDTTVPAAAAPDAASSYAIPKPDTSDPTILKGWSAVLARDCVKCHEPPDANDGILSGGVVPVPGTKAWAANLTPDPDTGLDGWDGGAIITAIRTGVDVDGDDLCDTMPRFGDMSDDEAAAIAAYLQSLVAVHHLVPDSICPPLKTGEKDSGVDASGDGGGDGGDAGGDASDAGADG
jgi:mono/diheme cytochrome c family protein